MKRKILVIVTAVALAIAMMPAMVFAGTSSDEVTVKFTAGVPGSFDMVEESITATGNLTEIFFPEITTEPEEGVSYSDVIVAAHIEKYGAGKVRDYLKFAESNSGWINMQFGHGITGFYYRNGKLIDTTTSEAVVENGDALFAGAYSDYNYADLHSSFDKNAYKATAGKKFSVKIKCDNWEGEFVPDTAKIATVNKTTGKFTALQTNYSKGTKEGTASAAINTVGVHYISCDGSISYESTYNGSVTAKCAGALAKVTVGLDKAKITKKTAKKKQITLKWNKVTGAKNYQVYRATKKTGKYKKVATTTKTSYTNKKLKKNKKYFYKVRAIAVAGGKTYQGAFSAIASVKTKK